jgi:hypothetical protein
MILATRMHYPEVKTYSLNVSDHLKTYFSESLPGVSESPFVA